MHKTSREYQSALFDFMDKFKGVQFFNESGCRMNKPYMFDLIWKNHICVHENVPFRVDKDTMCQLLANGNHPNFRTTKREFTDFNEVEEMRSICRDVFNRRAISVVRDRVKTPVISPIEAIELVAYAMEKVYHEYKTIDKEIEQKFSRV